ncbi:MAG: 3-methyl-2-oxobutanoate hydroxymethyltransferase [Candidatus Dadabacteria bacterium]|nr:MAG: 3-methyl-2-oxobutanoate hydroxymethyltransferase [Candidatus Dadabacteria bacterium]
MRKITAPVIRSMKAEGRKIVMVTAYDAATARMIDEAGVDMALVGDSLGNVVQGQLNTLPVTIDDMIYHTRIVSRGIVHAHLSADMPFMSYQASKEDALRNAGRLVKEGFAESVKLEINEDHVETLYAINKAGIPVIGHIGLCPQSVLEMGGYKVQGRGRHEARRLLDLAKAIESAGAFAILIESVPRTLAAEITKSVRIPTIGIGAGPGCDGQVLVINDLLGLSPEPIPRFVKKYANLREVVDQSTRAFIDDVRSGAFPSEEHSYD